MPLTLRKALHITYPSFLSKQAISIAYEQQARACRTIGKRSVTPARKQLGLNQTYTGLNK